MVKDALAFVLGALFGMGLFVGDLVVGKVAWWLLR